MMNDHDEDEYDTLINNTLETMIHDMSYPDKSRHLTPTEQLDEIISRLQALQHRIATARAPHHEHRGLEPISTIADRWVEKTRNRLKKSGNMKALEAFNKAFQAAPPPPQSDKRDC